jgi:hypothetical protein
LIGIYVGSLSTAHYFHTSDSLSLLSSTSISSPDKDDPFLPPNTGGPSNNQHRQALAAAQEMVQKLQGQLKAVQNQQQQHNQPQAAGSHQGTESTAMPPTVCSRIFETTGQGQQQQQQHRLHIPTAMSLWTERLEAIHAASQLKLNDPKYVFSDFTAQLLQFVTPRLPQSVMTVPAFVGASGSGARSRGHGDTGGGDNDGIDDSSQWEAVGRVLEKTFARWQYVTALQQQNQQPTADSQPPPPPVQMVILGGSVLVGRNCRKLVKDLGLQLRFPQRECTYSHRLERFVQEFWSELVLQQQAGTSAGRNVNPEADAGGRAKGGRRRTKKNKDPVDTVLPLLQVTKVALGGTNTATGSRILEYDLIPPEARDPDIVLNAYSTNDMHVLTMNDAASGNQTLRSKLLDMTQDFVRTVLKRRPCGHAPPLVLHLDDYLGNEQREIASTMELSQTVNTLAQYYGIATMSYANMARQTVYGDTRESWFSPEGWWPTPETDVMEREIHPGMGMHISVVYVVAYNILNLATTYCSMESFHAESANLEYNESAMAKRIPLKNWYTDVPGKPHATPRGLPPILTPELRLDNVTEEWKALSTREDELLQAVDCHDASYSSTKCIFSWVSGLSLQQNNKTWIKELFAVHETSPTKWYLEDGGGKLGLIPSNMGDSTVLEFSNLKQPIGSITFFTLKSYGSKWKNSLLRVQASSQMRTQSPWEDLAEHFFSGIHSKNTSEMYTEEIALPDPVPVGGSLRLRYTLVSGTTFKIMGLAVCT